MAWQQGGQMGSYPARLVFPDRWHAAVPAAAGGDSLVEIGQGQHAGVAKFLGGGFVKPAGDQIGRGGGLGGQLLQRFEQLQLAFPELAAAIRFVVGLAHWGVGLGIHLGDLRLTPAVQTALGNEVIQAGVTAVQLNLDHQADQAPGRLVVAACDGADRIHRLLVGGLGLVAMFYPQVALGAVDNVKALGNCAQVREMVPT